MTRIKLIDLSTEFAPGLAPAVFSLKFKEVDIADDARYEAIELAYRTERSLEIEQDIAGGLTEVIPYKVKFREVSEGIITFTLEDAEYALSPSDT